GGGGPHDRAGAPRGAAAGRAGGGLAPFEPGGAVGGGPPPVGPAVPPTGVGPALAVVRDTRSGKEIARLTGYRPLSAAWHPSGATLVVASNNDDALHVHDGKTFRETATWPTTGALAAVRFNPSGDRLAGASWGARVSVIDMHT